jgi:hypothetical protein
MHPVVGSIVLPVRNPFHLDPEDSSISYYSFLWPKDQLGLVIRIDPANGHEFDPWITVLVDSMLGHCLLSEVKTF